MTKQITSNTKPRDIIDIVGVLYFDTNEEVKEAGDLGVLLLSAEDYGYYITSGGNKAPVIFWKDDIHDMALSHQNNYFHGKPMKLLEEDEYYNSLVNKSTNWKEIRHHFISEDNT